MKLSSLKALLDNKLSPAAFRSAITQDVTGYVESVGNPGSVVPVRVTEDIEMVLTLECVKVLCNLFIAEQLNSFELAFIADALQLSDSVDFDEGISDFVASMTDPEVYGPFTVEQAKGILNVA